MENRDAMTDSGMSATAQALEPDSGLGRLDRRRAVNSLRSVSSPTRVVVGVDDPLYCAGIAHALRRAGMEVVASAGDAENLARKTRAYHPDVTVVDLDLPPNVIDEDRIDAARHIRSINPEMAVLVLARSGEEQHASVLLAERPEGIGFLVKAHIRDAEDFTASVQRIVCGGTALDPGVVSALAGRRTATDPIDELTRRERSVLALMTQGRSNRFIAAELVVTVSAVERHITNIFAKLDLEANAAQHRRVLAVLRYLGR
jgi:DNA-binding NarL/FixJ family response regulator